MRLLLGVDPGMSGALAWLNIETCELYHLQDMPYRLVRGKRHIDCFELHEVLSKYKDKTFAAVVEKVGPAPKQSRPSIFKFGFSTGAIYGALAANDIPTYEAPPSVWKAALNLQKNATGAVSKAISKTESRKMAMKLWPHNVKLFERAKDDGRAEAALIAYFGLNHIDKHLGGSYFAQK